MFLIHQTCYCSDICIKPRKHSHSSAWSHFSSQAFEGVSPTDHCYTAVATSLWVVIKQQADVRLINNDSTSYVKNANTLLIDWDSCSLFYSPNCSVFIKQQKLYSNATCSLELILDLETECCEDEWRSKPSINDFNSVWQRDSRLNQTVGFLLLSLITVEISWNCRKGIGNFWELIMKLTKLLLFLSSLFATFECFNSGWFYFLLTCFHQMKITVVFLSVACRTHLSNVQPKLRFC